MTIREKHAEMEKILDELIYAVEHEECHGRAWKDGDDMPHAEVPPLDLGLAYVRACAVLGREPKFSGPPDAEREP